MMPAGVFYKKEGLAGPSQSSLLCKSSKKPLFAQVFYAFLCLVSINIFRLIFRIFANGKYRIFICLCNILSFVKKNETAYI